MSKTVRAIDVGFDLRHVGTPTALDDIPDGTEIDYDGPDGPLTARGDLESICRELAQAGYPIIAAVAPNGREIRCEPPTGMFAAQPPHDNYWAEFDSLQDAAAFARATMGDPT